MATIDFSIPLWDTCKAHTSYEAYEYLKKAQEHSDETKEDKFSRFQTTAYLLLSVAMTFFHGLSVEAQVLRVGALYYFSGETESAKDVFTEKGKEGLKTLGFSLYQLFLVCVAVFYPSEVGSRLTLPKLVQLQPSPLSHESQPSESIYDHETPPYHEPLPGEGIWGDGGDSYPVPEDILGHESPPDQRDGEFPDLLFLAALHEYLGS